MNKPIVTKEALVHILSKGLPPKFKARYILTFYDGPNLVFSKLGKIKYKVKDTWLIGNTNVEAVLEGRVTYILYEQYVDFLNNPMMVWEHHLHADTINFHLDTDIELKSG